MSSIEDAKGPESFLSFEERTQLRRFLRFPEEFPPEFGAWIAEYISVNGSLSQSQIQGGNAGVWRDYTPTWGSFSGTPPTLGSGSLTGRYTRLADTVWASITLIPGSTTNFGANPVFWIFSLPVEVGSTAAGVGRLFDASTGGQHPLTITTYADSVTPFSSSTGFFVTPTQPITLADNDVMHFSITYEADS